MPIQNEKVREHTLLKAMLTDGYFPKHLVGKGQDLLRQLAERIEREAPEGEAVYKLNAGHDRGLQRAAGGVRRGRQRDRDRGARGDRR